MSGKEMAGAKGPPGDVIDVDDHLLAPYVSTYGQDVLKLLAEFNKKARYVYDKNGQLEHVLYNGKLLQPFQFKACERILKFKDVENTYKQHYLLRDIITVYTAGEFGEKFKDAINEVHKLEKKMHDKRPLKKAWREMQKRVSVAEVAKAATKAAKACEAEQLGGGMSSGGGAARDSGKKRKDP